MSSRLGRIGELIVEAELLKRGFFVSVPSVDEGVDLVVCGLDIQVKSASLSEVMRGHRFHVFGRKNKRQGRIDFYVLYGYVPGGEQTFWIVPAEELADCGDSLSLYPGKGGKSAELEKYIDRWDLLWQAE